MEIDHLLLYRAWILLGDAQEFVDAWQGNHQLDHYEGSPEALRRQLEALADEIQPISGTSWPPAPATGAEGS